MAEGLDKMTLGELIKEIIDKNVLIAHCVADLHNVKAIKCFYPSADFDSYKKQTKTNLNYEEQIKKDFVEELNRRKKEHYKEMIL